MLGYSGEATLHACGRVWYSGVLSDFGTEVIARTSLEVHLGRVTAEGASPTVALVTWFCYTTVHGATVPPVMAQALPFYVGVSVASSVLHMVRIQQRV